MAVPQRRTSKTRKRIRRTHFRLEEIGLVKCPNCGEMIESHRICPVCGFYNGKPVTAKAVKAEEAKKAAQAPKAKKSTKKAAAKKEAPVDDTVVEAKVDEVKTEETKAEETK